MKFPDRFSKNTNIKFHANRCVERRVFLADGRTDGRTNRRQLIVTFCGPGSSVGIATDYGLDCPGSNPGGDEIFRTCPDRPWGPPSLLYNGYRVFPGGKERPGRYADPSPPSSAVGHERVKLYLYSPYGPYGLYRASVPVQR